MIISKLWLLLSVTAAIGLLPCGAIFAAGSVIFIRAADTNSNLKDGITQSLKDVDELIQHMKDAHLVVPAAIDIQGDKFSCTAIKNALGTLQTNADDVVVFLYFGHGLATGPESAFPEFDCQRLDAVSAADDISSSARLDDVFKVLKAKSHPPRLVFAVADACNRVGRSTAGVLAAAGPIV